MRFIEKVYILSYPVGVTRDEPTFGLLLRTFCVKNLLGRRTQSVKNPLGRRTQSVKNPLGRRTQSRCITTFHHGSNLAPSHYAPYHLMNSTTRKKSTLSKKPTTLRL